MINGLIRGKLNLYKYTFDTSRDQIPPNTIIQLPNKIFKFYIMEVNANLNTSLQIKLKTKG